jgi:hypothetical protein
VNNQTAFPLSRMTIGSLQDLGYSVDYSQTDAYSKADLNPSCTCGGRRALPASTVAKATVPQRHLSRKGHQEAVSYGRKVLAEAQEQRDLAGHSENDAAIQYLGDEMVTVFYMENGHIFDVDVHSNA